MVLPRPIGWSLPVIALLLSTWSTAQSTSTYHTVPRHNINNTLVDSIPSAWIRKPFAYVRKHSKEDAGTCDYLLYLIVPHEAKMTYERQSTTDSNGVLRIVYKEIHNNALATKGLFEETLIPLTTKAAEVHIFVQPSPTGPDSAAQTVDPDSVVVWIDYADDQAPFKCGNTTPLLNQLSFHTPNFGGFFFDDLGFISGTVTPSSGNNFTIVETAQASVLEYRRIPSTTLSGLVTYNVTMNEGSSIGLPMRHMKSKAY